jgi:hypothetical protein
LTAGSRAEKNPARHLRIPHHHDEAYVGALAVVRAIRLVSQSDYAVENLLTDVALDLPDS